MMEGMNAARGNPWASGAPQVRVGGVAGAIFVILIVIAVTVVPGAPSADATTRTITAYYLDHHDGIVASSILTLVSVAFLLVGLSALRNALRVAEGAEGFLATAVFGAGVVLAVVLVVQAVLSDALAQRIVFDGGATVSGTFEITLVLGRAGTALPIGVILVATSIIGLRARLWPPLRPIAAVGALAGALGIVGAIAVLGNDTSALSVFTTVAFDGLIVGSTLMSGLLITCPVYCGPLQNLPGPGPVPKRVDERSNQSS